MTPPTAPYEHGTTRMYAHGPCRCNPCRAAACAASRAQRERQPERACIAGCGAIVGVHNKTGLCIRCFVAKRATEHNPCSACPDGLAMTGDVVCTRCRKQIAGLAKRRKEAERSGARA